MSKTISRRPTAGSTGSKPLGKPIRKSLVSKRPKPDAFSSASSEEEDEGDPSVGRDAMLAALQAHGQAMFGGEQASSHAESSLQAQRRAASLSGSDSAEEDDSEDGDAEGFSSDDGWGADDGFVSDSEDELAPSMAKAKTPEVIRSSVPEVVFAPSLGSSTTLLSKSERKAFLNGSSTKLMGIKKEVDYEPRRSKRPREGSEDAAEDQSNLKLDQTLHNMLLTTLLPSSTLETASRPSEKRNAITGRLLELASYKLPGEGSKSLKTSSLTSTPAKIRTGIIHAQNRRDEKVREEAEAAGGKIRGMGGKKERERGGGNGEKRLRLGEEAGRKKGMEGRKDERSRGLGGGLGKFEGGMLRLSERDIARGNAEGRGEFRGRGRGGRGRSGGRGRGGKR